jgi:hypothetical protein
MREPEWTRDIAVAAYSGYRADERPIAVTWAGASREVAEVLDRWHGLGYRYFKVRLADGRRLMLRHDEWDHRWDGAPLDPPASP